MIRRAAAWLRGGLTGVTGSLPGEPPGGSGPPGWLRGRLFERRLVFISGRLDDAVAAQAAAELMALDATGDGPIDIYLDSPDGTLEAAFVLIDTLDLLRATVHVRCRGHVGGPAIGVVAAADQRSAFPHTRFRMAQPTAQFGGTADQIAGHSRQQLDLLWKLEARVARAAGRSVEDVADDMRRGRSLDAGEALAYGLIDAIATRAP
jgi:ATP-dependent Clp protease protease subunit